MSFSSALAGYRFNGPVELLALFVCFHATNGFTRVCVIIVHGCARSTLRNADVFTLLRIALFLAFLASWLVVLVWLVECMRD